MSVRRVAIGGCRCQGAGLNCDAMLVSRLWYEYGCEYVRRVMNERAPWEPFFAPRNVRDEHKSAFIINHSQSQSIIISCDPPST